MRNFAFHLAAPMLLSPVAAAAHDVPAPRAAPAPGGWVDMGSSSYERYDYPYAGGVWGPFAPSSYVRAPTPGPRVYQYANGMRIWYGPPISTPEMHVVDAPSRRASPLPQEVHVDHHVRDHVAHR
jgi:hypothetical protein